MMERDWSSPFGGRAISAALMAAEKGLRTRQRTMRAARDGVMAEGYGNEGRVADKWQLLRALTQARAVFAVGDRTLAVLNALLSFHPGKGIDGAAPQIVFPSNRELGLRALGMAPSTLRRHLAALVEAGLILRRDSPNGKRYMRRNGAMAGEGPSEEPSVVQDSFGFDLSPLALLAPRIFAEQERAEAAAREDRRQRTAISLLRRDIAKVLEAAFAEAREGPFERFAAEFASLLPPRRGPGAGGLDMLIERLVRLCTEVENAYLAGLSSEELSANDAESERHYHNSKPDSFELNGHRQKAGAKPSQASETTDMGGEGARRVTSRPGPGSSSVPRNLERKGSDLATVLRVCPDIADFSSGPIASLADLARAAETVRAALGISAHAYEEAKSVMGPHAAAVVVAAMLQRATRIRSAGGYLRRLTEKARDGTFSLQPMLRALE